MKEHGKSITLAVLGVILLGITIAYAALQTNLNISGSVETTAVEWDIHFTNFTRSNVTGSATGPTAEELTTGGYLNNTSISHLAISLPKPGDSITYTFKIINNGTIDAKLNTYSAGWTCDTGKDCSHITYNLTCTNSATTQNSILYAKNDGSTDEASCTLTVSRNAATASGANQTYTEAAATGTINATWQYVQN